MSFFNYYGMSMNNEVIKYVMISIGTSSIVSPHRTLHQGACCLYSFFFLLVAELWFRLNWLMIDDCKIWRRQLPPNLSVTPWARLDSSMLLLVLVQVPTLHAISILDMLGTGVYKVVQVVEVGLGLGDGELLQIRTQIKAQDKTGMESPCASLGLRLAHDMFF